MHAPVESRRCILSTWFNSPHGPEGVAGGPGRAGPVRAPAVRVGGRQDRPGGSRAFAHRAAALPHPRFARARGPTTNRADSELVAPGLPRLLAIVPDDYDEQPSRTQSAALSDTGPRRRASESARQRPPALRAVTDPARDFSFD